MPATREFDRELTDTGGMGVVVRVLAIAAVAIVGFFGLTVLGGGFDAPDANIGAGLVVFVVFVVGSFGWAAFDGWRGAGSAVLGQLGPLVLRWTIVAALVPVLVTAVLVLVGGVAADWAWPEPMWLWLTQFMMSFLPALVGLGTGYAVRALSSSGSPTR